jgi:hypothetical protein
VTRGTNYEPFLFRLYRRSFLRYGRDNNRAVRWRKDGKDREIAMSDFETAVERAAEATRDVETEAEHGGEVRQECEAEAYADTLGRLHQAYRFDGMVMVLIRSSGVALCVTDEYFDEHFGDRTDIAYEPMPVHGSVQKSIQHEGVKISCLQDAKFAVIA